MSMESMRADEERLTKEMEGIDSKISIYSESVKEMIDYIVTFSELAKSASVYYRLALDSEKQELATSMFSELVFDGRVLVKYSAKDGFDALLARSVAACSTCWTHSEPSIGRNCKEKCSGCR